MGFRADRERDICPQPSVGSTLSRALEGVRCEMQIVTRSEARSNNLTRYYTGKPCRYGHLASRYTKDARCLDCCKILSAQSRERHIERRRLQDREYARGKSAERREYLAAYRAEKPEIIKAAERRWRLANPERRRANNAAYHAAKLQRTPPWADMAAIQRFYESCPDGLQVDHIAPLRGKMISGLHVIENLQYLRPFDNRSKGNQFDTEQTFGEVLAHNAVVDRLCPARSPAL